MNEEIAKFKSLIYRIAINIAIKKMQGIQSVNEVEEFSEWMKCNLSWKLFAIQ